MDRETIKQEIRRNWRQILQTMTEPAKRRVNGEASFVCPLCGHGTHGDGLTRNPRSTDGNALKCFGCGFSGDIIDLYQKQTNADYNTALSLLAQEIGVIIAPDKPIVSASVTAYASISHQNAARSDLNSQVYTDIPKQSKTQQRAPQPSQQAPQQEPQAKPPANYVEYYRVCRERLKDPAAKAYLKARGISPAIAYFHWIGFDPAADPANAPGALDDAGKLYPTPRMIIPTCNGHYVGRSIDPNTKKIYAKMNPSIDKGAANPTFFNLHLLYEPSVQVVFVTEAAFDALSVFEALVETNGLEVLETKKVAAIALNSANKADDFIKQLEQRITTKTLILCMDNDGAGKGATDTIKQGLKRLNIRYIIADICNGYKDPNDALVADREAFCEAIERAQQQATSRPDNSAYYINNLMSGEIDRFRAVKKTGFANLDKKTRGLNTGLYAIAAISSLGKTTFAAQIADQLAADGHDVLFFSLEQSRLELVSKSIARKMAQNDMKTAVTSLDIRRGVLPKEMLTAAKEYAKTVGDRISVIEGNFSCNLSFIGDYIRQYIQRTDTRPVVFVDYLQILQPEQTVKRQQTTRDIVNEAVTELKRMSRDLDLTVFVISSVNRANYLTPIDFESLKESGGIEYTCDCVWGLQLQCLNEPLFDKANNIKERRARIKEAKSENPRKIELVCLKNRYGIAHFSCFFDYYPANDLFISCNETDLDFMETAPQARAGRKL